MEKSITGGLKSISHSDLVFPKLENRSVECSSKLIFLKKSLHAEIQHIRDKGSRLVYSLTCYISTCQILFLEKATFNPSSPHSAIVLSSQSMTTSGRMSFKEPMVNLKNLKPNPKQVSAIMVNGSYLQVNAVRIPTLAPVIIQHQWCSCEPSPPAQRSFRGVLTTPHIFLAPP